MLNWIEIGGIFLRLSRSFFILIFVVLLTACSNTEEPKKIVGETPSESKGAFAFEGSIYTIDRGKVFVENVGKEIGEIKAIVDEINENGEAVIYDSTLNLQVGTKIFKRIEQDRSNTVVAIKIDDTYYGAFFNSNLN
ncbi:hypothetical protein GCM10011351_03440 [Paraliobacillus quinghaiensis]|uniref:Uncharacterized protein n=1 Tax=Paraliobacillus quinghaiensis TaxID=470815 RepID=A0A917TFX5_9BACI|nr:hypothetical protein [Paraliobacillus quinghaiensis]GGM20895.1 hypothetical protein GCM10011351_03440 [Paraliobacillus quinghaiensis]